MSVVVYQCDTCKRQIELERNYDGLERIQRCVITHGCRGKLFQVRVLPDYVRGQLPDPVDGLDDWIQRKVLYNHTQAVERDEWIITHNMGTYPIVSVFVDRPIEGNLDNREEVTPTDIVIVNDNIITLKFERPYSGIAQCVGRQSDPDLLRPYERVVETTADAEQFSSAGIISIATLSHEPVVTLNVDYDTADGSVPRIQYSIDDQPSIGSPWLDFNQVIIRGKKYTVRSYQGVVPEMTTGVISSGSTFHFANMDKTNTQVFEDIFPGEVYILLSDSPHERIDKKRNVLIDVTSVTATKNPFGLYYDSGEFFAQPYIIENVYPPIRSV
jgi:hypothetical protein